MIRVLITGSRDWEDRALVWSAIEDYLRERCALDADGMPDPARDVVIVHGGCRTGADAIASDWATLHGVCEETWRADWRHYGPGAGPRRNTAMVASGADVCLAFPLWCSLVNCKRYGSREHWTHGTDDCAMRAQHARIEVRAYGVQHPGRRSA